MIEFFRQVMKLLNLGGKIYIEIPDRTVGPYAETMMQQFKQNPAQALGTVRDTTPVVTSASTIVSGNEEDTPRYFAGETELRLALKAVGLEFGPDDVQTYLITSRDSVTGKTHLKVKEMVIVGTKPNG